MKYSVIIPIYNAEKTLRRCLDSLLPQLNSDIEVLLINDGSTDSSADICNEYLGECDSFKYFEQKNAGASAARNKGIDNAIGDYLLFIDSDDYVAPNYFSTIDTFIDDSHELLIFGLSFLKREQHNMIYETEEEYSGANAIMQFSILSKKQNLYSLCNKVFKRKTVIDNKIKFNQIISVGEDSAFVFQYILHVESFQTCKPVLYYVDESAEGSLSRKKRNNLCDDLILSYKDIEKHLLDISLTDTPKKAYYSILSRAYYRSAYSCFLEISRFEYDRQKVNNEIKKVCEAYRNGNIKPIGIETRVIAVPVLWKLTFLIKLLLRAKG